MFCCSFGIYTAVCTLRLLCNITGSPRLFRTYKSKQQRNLKSATTARNISMCGISHV